MPDPTTTAAWDALSRHYGEIAPLHMRDLFAADPARFDRFSLKFNDILVDYSKNRITAETMSLLRGLAEQCEIKEWTEKMFRGEPINVTERRAVLHTALRNQSGRPVFVDGRDVMPDVQSVLDQMRRFS